MSMAALYGGLVIVAFGLFAGVLAVVSERTEAFLTKHRPN